MKIICECLKYQYKQYMLSAKYVMPEIVLALLLAAMYSMTPLKIVNSFSVMGLFVFMIMVWVGITNFDVEPEVSEQILVLRLQSERKYYVIHVVFVGLVSIVVTAVTIMIPVLMNLLKGGGVFGRNIIWSDITGGCLLTFACAFVGGMVGELFHPRIVKNRVAGYGLTVLSVLLSLVHVGMIEKFPFSKWFTWMVPPVSDVVSWFSNQDYYDLSRLTGGFLLLMGYGMIFAVIKVELLKRKKF